MTSSTLARCDWYFCAVQVGSLTGWPRHRYRLGTSRTEHGTGPGSVGAQQLVDETIKENTVRCSILACGKVQSNMMVCGQRALSSCGACSTRQLQPLARLPAVQQVSFELQKACACPYGTLQHCMRLHICMSMCHKTVLPNHLAAAARLQLRCFTTSERSRCQEHTPYD